MISPRWSTTHLLCPEPGDRHARLCACAERFDGMPWWWADVGTAIPTLEIGVWSSVPVGTDDPLILEPSLFPYRVIPQWFPVALAETGLHALAVLSESDPPAEPVPWRRVIDEIGRLYAGLVPDLEDRRRVLHWHEQWLRGSTLGPAEASVRSALVARVAHLQTVRLRWPRSESEPDREVRMIHDLA